jgi:hypothetical protein
MSDLALGVTIISGKDISIILDIRYVIRGGHMTKKILFGVFIVVLIVFCTVPVQAGLIIPFKVSGGDEIMADQGQPNAPPPMDVKMKFLKEKGTFDNKPVSLSSYFEIIPFTFF